MTCTVLMKFILPVPPRIAPRDDGNPSALDWVAAERNLCRITRTETRAHEDEVYDMHGVDGARQSCSRGTGRGGSFLARHGPIQGRWCCR
jgi:hypothetical protein